MLENFLTTKESTGDFDCNWNSQKIQIPMAVLSWGNVDGASSKTRVPCVVIWWKAGANHRRPDNYSFSTKKRKTELTKVEEWALVAAPPLDLVRPQAAGVGQHRAPFCTPEYFTSLKYFTLCLAHQAGSDVCQDAPSRSAAVPSFSSPVGGWCSPK